MWPCHSWMCVSPSCFSIAAKASERSTLVVPTRTGRPCLLYILISVTAAPHLPAQTMTPQSSCASCTKRSDAHIVSSYHMVQADQVSAGRVIPASLLKTTSGLSVLDKGLFVGTSVTSRP